MIGIYKITNINNGKVYIGQSVRIKIRWWYHKNCPSPYSLIDKELQKDLSSFKFEVIEECDIEKLDEREIYWIDYYNSYKQGYNLTIGGNSLRYEDNPNSILTKDDVFNIREEYNKKNKTKREIYEKYSDKISFRGFEKVWNNETWIGINEKVYTEENKKYYLTKGKARPGSLNGNHTFTDEEVLEIRNLYQTLSISQIATLYKDRCSKSCIERILLGSTYKNLPIYQKSIKKWTNI